MLKKEKKEGEKIINQGEEGDEMYLIQEGKLSCSKFLEDPNSETHLRNYVDGESFGELALLYNLPRAANIRATTNCTLWSINRKIFN